MDANGLEGHVTSMPAHVGGELEITKIAVASDDGQTISQHFGQERGYVVLTLENGHVERRESRDKLGHTDFAGHHHHGHQHGVGLEEEYRHGMMFAPITDCEVCAVGGMGVGAYENSRSLGIRPIVTDMMSIDEAVQAFIEDRLENHAERIHRLPIMDNISQIVLYERGESNTDKRLGRP